MKRKIRSSSFTFGTLVLVVVFVALGSSAQEMHDGSGRLSFKIEGSKCVCLGKKFTLTARLTNISEKELVIDTHGIWRYVTEKALDRSSATMLGIPLDVPQMRGTISDGFSFQEDPPRFITLKPKESHRVDLIFNRSKDDFYRTVGRYVVSSLYGASALPEKAHPDLLKEPVQSPDFEFQIVDCKGRRSSK